MRRAIVIVLGLGLVLGAACSKKASKGSGSGSAGSGGSGGGGGSAGLGHVVDTAAWAKRGLDTLGTQPFSFAGTIKLPPGAETQTSALYGGDGAQIGVVAYVDLAGGLRVNIAERAKNSVNDPELLLKYMRTRGAVVMDRREPTWFMLAVDTNHGLELQGQFWAVPPGISCSTQQPINGDQAELVTAMCSTFAAP